MRIGTVYPDSEAYRDPSIQPYFLSGLRSYVGHRCIDNPDSECVSGRTSIQPYFLSGLRSYVGHRCIALLYLIPMGNFNYVIMSGSLGVVNELAEDLLFWNIPTCADLSAFFGKGNVI